MVDSDDVIISLLVLLVIAIFIAWVVYSFVRSRSEVKSNTPLSLQDTNFYRDCLPGQCLVDVASGAKTCPVGTEVMRANLISQVCSGRETCDDSKLPFALNSDGSTSADGQCEPGIVCSCLASPQCANYITSVFTAARGNPYDTLAGQRLTFPQVAPSPGQSFCLIPPSWLPLSNPGCNFIPANPSYEEIKLCMGMASGCQGLSGDPCAQGVLAFVTDDSSSLTQSDVATAQLACVVGNKCSSCDQVAIYDTSYGGVLCRELPP